MTNTTAAHALIQGLEDAALQIDDTLGTAFYYNLAFNEPCGEGEFALPLHTDDFWGTCLEVMEMTQEEFNDMVFSRIDEELLRYAR